jgi:hypothetical protein
VKATGSKSFHLAHTNGVIYPGVQTMQFNRSFYVKPGAKIDFKSRLGIASSNQVARVEVSEDREIWDPIWSQEGTNINGGFDFSEKSFNARSASLSNYVGKIVSIRFSFGFSRVGTYFPLTGASTDKDRAWYVDDILITDAMQPDDGAYFDLTAEPEFRFIPPSTGEYLVKVQAFHGTREFPWGAVRYVTAEANPPTLTLLNNPTISGGSITFQFTIAGTPTPFALDSSSNPNGPWSSEPNAVFSGPASGRYTVTAPTDGSQRFYRVRAN